MKKLNFILPLFVLLSACGVDVCEGSDFTTKHNLCVFKNGFNVTKEEIEYVTDATQQEVTRRHPNKYPKDEIYEFNDVSLKFVSELGDDRSGETEYRYGPFTDNRFRIRVEYWEDSCITRWYILVHEILHVYLLEQEGDDNHRKDWFIMKEFTKEENLSSIQYVVWNQIACELCSCE